jgi:cold shock CspA family protein
LNIKFGMDGVKLLPAAPTVQTFASPNTKSIVQTPAAKDPVNQKEHKRVSEIKLEQSLQYPLPWECYTCDSPTSNNTGILNVGVPDKQIPSTSQKHKCVEAASGLKPEAVSKTSPVNIEQPEHEQERESECEPLIQFDPWCVCDDVTKEPAPAPDSGLIAFDPWCSAGNVTSSAENEKTQIAVECTDQQVEIKNENVEPASIKEKEPTNETLESQKCSNVTEWAVQAPKQQAPHNSPLRAGVLAHAKYGAARSKYPNRFEYGFIVPEENQRTGQWVFFHRQDLPLSLKMRFDETYQRGGGARLEGTRLTYKVVPDAREGNEGKLRAVQIRMRMEQAASVQVHDNSSSHGAAGKSNAADASSSSASSSGIQCRGVLGKIIEAEWGGVKYGFVQASSGVDVPSEIVGRDIFVHRSEISSELLHMLEEQRVTSANCQFVVQPDPYRAGHFKATSVRVE